MEASIFDENANMERATIRLKCSTAVFGKFLQFVDYDQERFFLSVYIGSQQYFHLYLTSCTDVTVEKIIIATMVKILGKFNFNIFFLPNIDFDSEFLCYRKMDTFKIYKTSSAEE